MFLRHAAEVQSYTHHFRSCPGEGGYYRSADGPEMYVRFDSNDGRFHGEEELSDESLPGVFRIHQARERSS